ncbi:MAG TPA: Ig-like domain-containing protein [Gemmatimonadaceae bacterium]
MRLPLRVLSTLLIAAGVATCSDTPPAAVKHSSLGPSGGALGRVAFVPVFSASALQTAQHLVDFGIHYDHVRVTLTRPPSDVVRDTTIAFTPTSPDITLNLTVEVRSSDEVFEVGIDYLNTAGVVFHGHGRVRSHAPEQPSPQQEQISVEYVGPGANVARIDVSPKTSAVRTDGTLQFVAAAFDANNNAVAAVPLSWTTSDPSIATITGAGILQALERRGTVVVTASTPTGITDRATLVVVPPPSTISVVSGGGQTGVVATALGSPAVVQVNAADGVGVPGVNIVLAPPTGGGVAVTTLTTDANGRVSAGLTLGTVAGAQAFAATAGNLSTLIPETAVAGAPAGIEIISGNGQTDSIHKELAPLVVRVTDQFGNPVSGVAVSWTRSGAGFLEAVSSTTAADGRATTMYTLGNAVGTEGVTASVGGVTSHAVFSFQVVAGAPASIVLVSGNAQAARIGATLAAPLVVKVTDEAGNPVSSITVHWSATNASTAPTSLTDFAGRASANLTLGTVAGPASATASITGGRHVTFSATAQPGPVAALAFSTQPSNAVTGAAMSTVRVALLDAKGNQTAATNAVTISLANNPSGATLSGSLVRTAVNGVASFNDLKIDKAGNAYTLDASSAGATSSTSSAFNVTDAVASKLTIVAGDDQRAAAGSPVPVAPSVKVTDDAGNPVAGASVTFSPSDAGVVIPSTPLLTDASGIATLTSWTLGGHSGPQTLLVSSAGLPSVSLRAGAFGGPPAMLGMATQPSATAQSGALLDRQPVVQLLDHFGNSTATSNLTITVAVSAGTLLGTTSVVADPVTGLATFTDLKIVGSGDVTLTFTAQGVQSVTSSSITISAAQTTTETSNVRF